MPLHQVLVFPCRDCLKFFFELCNLRKHLHDSHYSGDQEAITDCLAYANTHIKAIKAEALDEKPVANTSHHQSEEPPESCTQNPTLIKQEPLDVGKKIIGSLYSPDGDLRVDIAIFGDFSYITLLNVLEQSSYTLLAEDIGQAQLKREELLQILGYRDFNDMVVGCYVRFARENGQFALKQVVQTGTCKSYCFDHRQTDMLLILEGCEKIRLSAVTDSPASREEVAAWAQARNATCRPASSLDHLRAKHARIQFALYEMSRESQRPVSATTTNAERPSSSGGLPSREKQIKRALRPTRKGATPRKITCSVQAYQFYRCKRLRKLAMESKNLVDDVLGGKELQPSDGININMGASPQRGATSPALSTLEVNEEEVVQFLDIPQSSAQCNTCETCAVSPPTTVVENCTSPPHAWGIRSPSLPNILPPETEPACGESSTMLAQSTPIPPPAVQLVPEANSQGQDVAGPSAEVPHIDRNGTHVWEEVPKIRLRMEAATGEYKAVQILRARSTREKCSRKLAFCFTGPAKHFGLAYYTKEETPNYKDRDYKEAIVHKGPRLGARPFSLFVKLHAEVARRTASTKPRKTIRRRRNKRPPVRSKSFVAAAAREWRKLPELEKDKIYRAYEEIYEQYRNEMENFKKEEAESASKNPDGLNAQ